MKRTILAAIAAVGAGTLVAAAAPADGGGTTTAPTETRNASSGVRTFAYRTNRSLVGWVERTGVRNWWASNGGNSEIYADRKGGYAITEGFRAYAYAWPRPRTQRREYFVRYGYAGGPRYTFRRSSATRWNIFRAGRRVAFTKGPDGVAAALAFAFWGDDMLPD